LQRCSQKKNSVPAYDEVTGEHWCETTDQERLDLAWRLGQG
jgi:hypothetical protein